MQPWSIVVPWPLAFGGLVLAYGNLLIFRINPMGPVGISKQAKTLALIMPTSALIASVVAFALNRSTESVSRLLALLVPPVLIAVHSIMKTPPVGDPREHASERVRNFNSHWLWW